MRNFGRVLFWALVIAGGLTMAGVCAVLYVALVLTYGTPRPR